MYLAVHTEGANAPRNLGLGLFFLSSSYFHGYLEILFINNILLCIAGDDKERTGGHERNGALDGKDTQCYHLHCFDMN